MTDQEKIAYLEQALREKDHELIRARQEFSSQIAANDLGDALTAAQDSANGTRTWVYAATTRRQGCRNRPAHQGGRHITGSHRHVEWFRRGRIAQ